MQQESDSHAFRDSRYKETNGSEWPKVQMGFAGSIREIEIGKADNWKPNIYFILKSNLKANLIIQSKRFGTVQNFWIRKKELLHRPKFISHQISLRFEVWIQFHYFDRTPNLNWIGKEKVQKHHLDVPLHILESKYIFPEKSSSSKEKDTAEIEPT